MKSKRQEQILALIQDHDIETQEQLLDELKKSGFQATQATISRDIKQLRIIKELGPNGTYRYVSSPKPVEHAFSAKLNMIFRQCVTSIDYAQNLIVIKTMPGLANAAWSCRRCLVRSRVTTRAWSSCATMRLPRRSVRRSVNRSKSDRQDGQRRG